MWDYVKYCISITGMYVCTNVDIEIHMRDHLHTFNSSLVFFIWSMVIRVCLVSSHPLDSYNICIIQDFHGTTHIGLELCI